MSIHMKMSAKAEAALKQDAKRNKQSALGACLGFMAIGSCILYFTAILIKNVEPPAFDTYIAPNEDAPNKKPKVKELSSKTASPSSQVAPSVIVSASAAVVSMAEVDIPTTSVTVGTGMDIGMGLGTGLGDGLGDGGGGLGSGESGGSTLEGTFYDLKLTKNGASTGIAWDKSMLTQSSRDKIGKVIGEFFDSNWNERFLSKYYQSPTKLYASNFYLPSCDAAYGPKAFKADAKVKPSGWCAVYRGKITAPKTGKFRFVGSGDDVMAVRFNRKLVLEGGYSIPSLCKNGYSKARGTDKNYQKKIKTYKDHDDYQLIKDNTKGWWNTALGGLTAGTVINVQEGHDYPIEIFISEIPGGIFGMVLLIEDLSATEANDGKPVYDIFRTNFSLPNMKELQAQLKEANAYKSSAAPTYNQDSLIWTVKP